MQRELRAPPSTVALSAFTPWFDRFTEQAAETAGRGLGHAPATPPTMGDSQSTIQPPLLLPVNGSALLLPVSLCSFEAMYSQALTRAVHKLWFCVTWMLVCLL